MATKSRPQQLRFAWPETTIEMVGGEFTLSPRGREVSLYSSIRVERKKPGTLTPGTPRVLQEQAFRHILLEA